jgi:dihydroorotate dehydrogenase (fumarate)
MVDLSTTYLGLQLKNPLVASASPLSRQLDAVRRLEDAGVSAVVMYSLFEEQILHDSRSLDYFLNRGTEQFAEALSYFPKMETYNIGPDKYLDLIRKLKSSVHIPIIGSLNGISSGGWIDYGRKIQEAGADALELNIYFLPTDANMTSQELEQAYIDLVADMRKQVRIPLAVKLSPYFSALPNFAKKLVTAGADGLVLFNRFYQPDLDIETLEVVPNLVLSTSEEMRLPLRWIAILYRRIQADLALTSGVHTPIDLVKALMAGASVVQTASALLKHGEKYAVELVSGLHTWLETYEYVSVKQMIGSMSQQAVAEPAVFERANYMKTLQAFDYRVV